MASRSMIKTDQQVVANPGPGEYKQSNANLVGESKSPAFSMKFRPQKDHLNQTIDVPGPGQYIPSPTKSKGSFAFTMGARV